MANTLTKEEETVRQILISVACKRTIIKYSELCQKALLPLDMGIPAHRGEIGHILGNISAYEHYSGRPLLSSVVLSANNKQGDGFFKLAEELGFGDWNKLKKEEIFEYDMINKTHEYWSK